jgi:hypothetical protein
MPDGHHDLKGIAEVHLARGEASLTKSIPAKFKKSTYLIWSRSGASATIGFANDRELCCADHNWVLGRTEWPVRKSDAPVWSLEHGT